ncbi:MAG: ABC transporter permease [Anaerolineae bacterium]
MKSRGQALLSVAFGVLLLVLWYLLVAWQQYPAFTLPRPDVVARKAVVVIGDGTLWRHARVTLVEVFAGLGLGVTVAVVVGYVLARWQALERILSPYVVGAQSIPIVALAPLLVIWFGFGLLSKVLVCALIVFFPMMVSTIIGIRSVPADLAEAMRVMRANSWQTLVKLEIPAALPVLFGGLRLSVTLAVVGAVVGEFVGADRGLGFLVNLAKGLFDTPLMFVALATLMAIAVGLYVIVLVLEHKLLAWR